MPLPLIPVIFGLAALATGGIGVAKGVKAISDNSKANDLNREANGLIEEAKNSLNNARNVSKQSLENLGEKKLYFCQSPLARFVKLFEQIKNVEFENPTDCDELAKFKIDRQNFSELKDVTSLASSFSNGTFGGAIAGGAVAFGAYGVAGTFAAASTGTAIAGLSGAAATNATLAFFGGGSLVAGGLGIAGGTMVLGGLVAGPALAVLGLVMGAKASANLDNARSNLAQARKVREEISVMVTTCNGIKERARLYSRVLTKLDLLLDPMLNGFEDIIQAEGLDYSSYSQTSKGNIIVLLSAVKMVKAVIDTSLLDANGALTPESEEVVAEVQRRIGA